MHKVSAEEIEAKFAKFLAAVEAGDTIVVCRDSKPVAELKPVFQTGSRLRTNPALGPVVFHDDPMKPLDPGDWQES
jgi:antitoxin (DNA-binding transcriptional repressor) of toxin-antitoxin stability system